MQTSKGRPRAPRIPPELAGYPIQAHSGPYAFERSPHRLAETTVLLALIVLRRSLGHTRHPWIWVAVRQLMIVAPLVAVAGASGNAVLVAQVIVVASLARIAARAYRFRHWAASYHRRACPAPEQFGTLRVVDLAGANGAVIEVTPVLILGAVVWVIVSPRLALLPVFVFTVLMGVLVTYVVSICLLPVLARIEAADHPDVRPVFMLSMTFVFALGMLVFSPSSVLSVPAPLLEALQCLPWLPWIFLPLNVGTHTAPVWTLGVSALLTVASCLVLWHFGAIGSLDEEDDTDDEDTQDDEDEGSRGRRR
ncbi:MAG: hypothetical protein Q7L55_10255 [Actinomycetota bacterium]|nr:hypothetical protein [Actinomycetota bacterium]